ncbi:MAG: DUF4150 domain-containing protein [Planctomycetes bacterium]|nr:DUF4150 domain-containing protein [Planctomycetota bacterium]
MMPSSNQGVGDNQGFPDVCNTPVGAATSPIPYLNDGTNAAAMPMTPTIILSMIPGHNQAAKPLMTNGDEAGCAHSSFIMSGGNNLGNARILLSGVPAETLANPTQGNNYNCSTGAKLVPSLTNVLMGWAAPDPGELLDAPSGAGLLLEGRRVRHVRRGSPAARAGVRADDHLLRVERRGRAARWRVQRRGRTLELAGPAAWAKGPVAARLDRDGVGVLVVRRCSVGAAAGAWTAARALERAGARALVLDLAGNPGGLVSAGAALAGLALPAGAEVLAWDGAAAAPGARWRTVADGPFAGRPVVVRVDEGTASSAEAAAAVLQAHGRPVVGERTAGKLEATAGGHAGPLRGPGGARLSAVTPVTGACRLAARRALRPEEARG